MTNSKKLKIEKFKPPQNLKGEELKKAAVEHYVNELKAIFKEHKWPEGDVEKNFLAEVQKHPSIEPSDLFVLAEKFLWEKISKKLATKDLDRKMLVEHFKDRSLSQISKFKEYGKKTTGPLMGFVSKEPNHESSLFMIKSVGLTADDRLPTEEFNMTFVNEFVTAGFYSRFLHSRAPLIELVEKDDKSFKKNLIYFRSKFLSSFQTLSRFTKGKELEGLGSARTEDLKRINEVEKVFASMFFLGEYDLDAGNLGVMEENGELFLAKIDHGWSATQFFTDPKIALKNLANAYKRYSYLGKLPLRVDKFKEALIEMASISDAEIDKIIESRIYKLKQLGFDPRGIKFKFWIDDKEHSYEKFTPNEEKDFDNLVALEKYYKNFFKKQKEVMKEIIELLDIIPRLDFFGESLERWENGEWLNMENGPMDYAKEHGLAIDGMDPDKWKKIFDKRKKLMNEGRFKELLLSFGFVERPSVSSMHKNVVKNKKAIRKFCEYILSHRHILLHSNPKIIDEVLKLQRILKSEHISIDPQLSQPIDSLLQMLTKLKEKAPTGNQPSLR